MPPRTRANALVLLVAFIFLLLIPLRSALGQDLPGGVDPASPAAVDTALSAAFNYQGQLRRSGSLYTGTCAMRFRLFDATTGGAQVGWDVPVGTVNVAGGAFDVALNFGSGAFTGDARWLETAVQCGADAAYTTLTPRQLVRPAPYAIGLRPHAVMRDGTVGDSFYVENSATNGNAIHGKGTAAGSIGVWGEGVSNTGVYGLSSTGVGVWGKSSYGYGVNGVSKGNNGVYGVSQTVSGIFGITSSAGYYGVYGRNLVGGGVAGTSWAGGAGVTGYALWQGGRGVYGIDDYQNSVGVYGEANAAGSVGVYGKSTNNTGVYGLTTSGIGVWGQSGSVGVYGAVNGSTSGRAAVRGIDNGADTSTGYAGLFSGRVSVNGKLITSAAVTTIDDPRDPANKTLSHAVVESPDMLNIYNGNVTTDNNGDATVTLPSYFDAINQDPRYQLTVVGQFAQAIVAEEIGGSQFKIKTDKPNVKVSWQVTGVRKDPYAAANRIVVEQDKSALERGRYYYPEGYGQPATLSISNLSGASADNAAGSQPYIPAEQAKSWPVPQENGEVFTEVQP